MEFNVHNFFWKYTPILTHNDTFKFSFIPNTIIAWNVLGLQATCLMVCTSIKVRTFFKVHLVLQSKYTLSGTDIRLNI